MIEKSYPWSSSVIIEPCVCVAIGHPRVLSCVVFGKQRVTPFEDCVESSPSADKRSHACVTVDIWRVTCVRGY